MKRADLTGRRFGRLTVVSYAAAVKGRAMWHNYEAFRAWALANGYHDALELDRVDNDGPYSPENCRWATRTVQMRNTRRARLLTFCGETKHLAEWAEELGIRASTIKDRLAAGWPVERALIAPVIEKVTA